jgi:hypothetical protein
LNRGDETAWACPKWGKKLTQKKGHLTGLASPKNPTVAHKKNIIHLVLQGFVAMERTRLGKTVGRTSGQISVQPNQEQESCI